MYMHIQLYISIHCIIPNFSTDTMLLVLSLLLSSPHRWSLSHKEPHSILLLTLLLRGGVSSSSVIWEWLLCLVLFCLLPHWSWIPKGSCSLYLLLDHFIFRLEESTYLNFQLLYAFWERVPLVCTSRVGLLDHSYMNG